MHPHDATYMLETNDKNLVSDGLYMRPSATTVPPRSVCPARFPLVVLQSPYAVTHSIYPGDVLSVPAYTIHHSTEIWGKNAHEFVPERWSSEHLSSRQKAAFLPFSIGPRACIGRNLAEMEMICIVGAIFHRFEFCLKQDRPMECIEGFIRRPVDLVVGLRRKV